MFADDLKMTKDYQLTDIFCPLRKYLLVYSIAKRLVIQRQLMDKESQSDMCVDTPRPLSGRSPVRVLHQRLHYQAAVRQGSPAKTLASEARRKALSRVIHTHINNKRTEVTRGCMLPSAPAS